MGFNRRYSNRMRAQIGLRALLYCGARDISLITLTLPPTDADNLIFQRGLQSSVVVVPALVTPNVQVAQKEVITPEIVNKIHEMILDDRRMKVRKLAHAIGISTERVHHILHEYLDMRKLSARWVPQLLTLDHKRNRVTTSKECLAMFSRNSDEFLRRFVTVDETWIHHNTPETKEQSKQWVSRGERGPKKAKQSLSANKVMATVFWDARGVIHIDYLEKGKTITGEYYSKLLDRFDVDLKQKTAAFGEEESAVPSRQCTCAHLFSHDGQNPRIEIRTATPSSIYSRFSPLLLLSVSKPKQMAGWIVGSRRDRGWFGRENKGTSRGSGSHTIPLLWGPRAPIQICRDTKNSYSLGGSSTFSWPRGATLAGKERRSTPESKCNVVRLWGACFHVPLGNPSIGSIELGDLHASFVSSLQQRKAASLTQLLLIYQVTGACLRRTYCRGPSQVQSLEAELGSSEISLAPPPAASAPRRPPADPRSVISPQLISLSKQQSFPCALSLVRACA
ncbi:Histone-lysine N-methyltransferase SETMAR [Eumeta japonica]|uniref:Histone-lysine N-methyltransferase SETMAR n=1 Tax=Eumeta variegata TaxID=151549 RepID=A0A4C1Z6S6_EUMVA|nr:Histone-lysine N-methyltransferase SETMAR [Eumeta japonica]